MIEQLTISIFLIVHHGYKSNVRGLGNKKPLNMLGTSAESQALLSLIGQLEKGVFV